MPYYTNTKVDGSDYIAAADLEAIETGFSDVDSDKANKVVPAATNDLAGLDSSGDLTDSGKTPPSGEIVGDTDTQTLTNKTLTSPTVTSIALTGGSLSGTFTGTPTFSGALTLSGGPSLTSPVLTTPQINDTSSNHQYVFGVSELAADRTVTLPLLTGSDTFVFQSHTQTLTNKTINSPTIDDPVFTGSIEEETYSLSGTAIDPANGTIQYKTLSSNTTFTSSLTEGESVTLLLDPSTYTVTWPTTKWRDGIAPVLTSSKFNVIEFIYMNSTLYGFYAGGFD